MPGKNKIGIEYKKKISQTDMNCQRTKQDISENRFSELLIIFRKENNADMSVKITECHSECGVNIGKMVKRMIKYSPPGTLKGLNEIQISDNDPNDIGFARYRKNERRIELYADDIIGRMPGC